MTVVQWMINLESKPASIRKYADTVIDGKIGKPKLYVKYVIFKRVKNRIKQIFIYKIIKSTIRV